MNFTQKLFAFHESINVFELVFFNINEGKVMFGHH